MSYNVELSDEAIEDLAKLKLPLRKTVENHLEVLAHYPTKFSEPAHFPYWQVQAYKFETAFEGVEYFFTVLFQYGADEQTLHILAIPEMHHPGEEEAG